MTDADIKEIQDAKKELSDFIKADLLNKSNIALIDALLQRMHPEQMSWLYRKDKAVRLAIETWSAQNIYRFME
jgi:hypothetical protein